MHEFPKQKGVPEVIMNSARMVIFKGSSLSVTGVSRESSRNVDPAPNHLFSMSNMSSDELKLRIALETSGTISKPLGNTWTR